MKALLMGLWRLMIHMGMILDMVMGVVDMEVDKVADGVTTCWWTWM